MKKRQKNLMMHSNILYSDGVCARTTRSVLAVFIVVAYTLGVSGIGETLAYYDDTETSSSNTFVAQSLDFSLSQNSFTGIQNFGATTTISTDVVNDGSLDFQYTTQTDSISCDSTFLSDLTLVAKRDGSEVYKGSVNGFTATTTDMSANWDFLLYLDPFSTVVHGAKCDFNITFKGWQKEFPSYSEGGYSDEETLPVSLTANAIVLNEILPNPEGADNQEGLQGEWVELYNNSVAPLDLTGWYVKDAKNHVITLTADSTFNGRVVIGARGSFLEWIVLYMTGSILNNDGDTISLYTPSGVLVDSYTYGNKANDADSDSNHTGGGGNGNLAGSETSGHEGKSDARKPDGYGAWVDPVPTPGLTNDLTDAQAEYMYQLMMEQFTLLKEQKEAALVKDVAEENATTTEMETVTATTTEGTVLSATTTEEVVLQATTTDETLLSTTTTERASSLATTTEANNDGEDAMSTTSASEEGNGGVAGDSPEGTGMGDTTTSSEDVADANSTGNTGETADQSADGNGNTTDGNAADEGSGTTALVQDQTLVVRKENDPVDNVSDASLDTPLPDNPIYREEDNADTPTESREESESGPPQNDSSDETSSASETTESADVVESTPTTATASTEAGVNESDSGTGTETSDAGTTDAGSSSESDGTSESAE